MNSWKWRIGLLSSLLIVVILSACSTSNSINGSGIGGSYPFICLFMNPTYVNSHKDVVQKLVNAYVKTLKWMHTHTAEQIADQMPADYYAGNKALYVTALQNQMAIFSPDGSMPAGAPQSVLNTEYQSNLIPQGKQIDLNATYTNEFTSKAS